MTCPRCDLDHTGCTAHTRAGKPCRGKVVAGMSVCRMHGGSSPQAKAAAARRREEAVVAERISEMLATYQPDVEDLDLHAQLLEVVALTSGMRRVLTVLVGELAPFGTPAYETQEYTEDGRPRGGPTYLPAQPAGLYGPDHQGDGKPHVLVEMLRHWADQNAKATKLALDAGVDERRVRVAERHAEELGEVVRSAVRAVVAAFAAHGAGDAIVRAVSAQLPGLMRESIERSGVIDVTSEET